MRPGFQSSPAALMLLILLAALELAYFQGIWFIVVVPPATVMIVTINVGLIFVLLRPRTWETRILGLLLGGGTAVIGIAIYYSRGVMPAGPPGPLGRVLQAFLMAWAGSLEDPAGNLAGILRRAGNNLTWIEAFCLDLLGLGAIGLGGWLEHSSRAARARFRATRLTGSIPSGRRGDERLMEPSSVSSPGPYPCTSGTSSPRPR